MAVLTITPEDTELPTRQPVRVTVVSKDGTRIKGSFLQETATNDAGYLPLKLTPSKVGQMYKVEVGPKVFLVRVAGNTTLDEGQHKVAENGMQGLYSRTRPNPSNTADDWLRVLAVDPNHGNGSRVWAVGHAFAQIGYTDNGGDTFSAKTGPPQPGQSVISLVFSASYLWALTTGSASKTGKVFRSPLPNATGGGIVWTEVFDLATAAGGANAIFRNSCLAVAEPYVYVGEYSTTPVVGGPSLYMSSNNGGSFTQVKQWAGGKHIHAVKVIGGVPWVSMGDGGADAQFPDIGVWTATSTAAATWNRRSLYGPSNNGTYEYGINMVPVTIDGSPSVLLEYDGYGPPGLLCFATQTPSVNRPITKLFTLPPQYGGSMRTLTVATKGSGIGNAYFVATCEGGVLGNKDSIWVSKAPYTEATLLEEITDTSYLSTLGDPVEEANHIWFGRERVRKELFPEQS